MQLIITQLGGSLGGALCGARSGGPQRRQGPPAHRRSSVRVAAGIFDDIFDFEKWAPRSSQRWRLGNPGFTREEVEATGEEGGSINEQSVDVLNQRLVDARRAESRGGSLLDSIEAEDEPSAASDPLAQFPERQPSFLASTDDELASALNQRLSQLRGSDSGSGSGAGSSSSSTGGGGGGITAVAAAEGDDAEQGERLTGQMLRNLIYAKWGKTYDVSFVRRDLPFGKVLVCLNVMWVHLEQRSFPMTEQEFNDKLETVAFYLNAWDQQQRVIDYLREPPKARRGLPRKPIVGIAIPIQLDVSEQIVEEFFSQGAQ